MTQTISKEQYNPNLTYRFTDKDGNTFESKGDNGYVWQSVTEGIPISKTSSGEWFTNPYLSSNGNQVTAYLPEWFKQSEEYSTWNTYASQIPKLSLTSETVSNLNNILKELGTSAATRTSLKNDIASYGVKNPDLQNKYYDWMMAMGQEAAGNGDAKIKGLLYGGEEESSVADIARYIKNLDKDTLSAFMTRYYNIAQQGMNGTWTGSEEDMMDAVATIKMLNYVDDNYKNFGKDEEFKGLLEASVWQKINAGGTSFMQTMMENFPLINLGARAAYGIGQSMQGKNFNMKIEEGREQLLSKPSAGYNLEGTEAAMQVGNVTGAVGNIAGTMALSVMLGNVISAKAAATSPGGFLSKVGDFARTIPGAMVTDFVLNDIPIDLTFFASDLSRHGGDVGKAWYNPEESQPLFGIPVIGNFGPQVANGLGMNLLGDAIIDVSLPVLSVVGSTSFKKLDQWTSGGVTRTREKVAVDNLKLQEKITNIPVFGDAWKKFINHMMGAENANFIREARKAAIAEGSMEPYVKAQNLLTLYNHAGMTDIAPLYKMLDQSLDISKDMKKFIKEASKYGGIGETRVEWKEVKSGMEKTYYKVIPDSMPRDVKQVLLDTERLSELKGEMANEGGGIIFNSARQKEIAQIEERLSKAPQELKDFAERFSMLNKGVEQIGVKLGVTNEEWLDSLNQDPRWQMYMTRQALTPGGYGTATAGGATNPSNAAILNKARKGYYAENYIDPQLSLSLKVEALGRAYAWNERAKAVVAFELAQGKITAGKNSVEIAKRLEEVKTEIKTRDAYRQEIGYDTETATFNGDMNSISNAFNKINDLLHLPEKLNLKAIFDTRQDPRIKGLVDEFETGKIKFAEGVKEAADLSDSDAAAIVRNTYLLNGSGSVTKAKTIFKDTTDVAPAKEIDYSMRISEEVWGDKMAADTFENLRNENGEIDAGIDGLTFSQIKKTGRELEAKDEAARKEWDKTNQQNFDEYQKKLFEWLDGEKKYLDEEWEKLTPAQKEKDPLATKIYDAYNKKYPKPERPPLTEFPKSAETEYLLRRSDVNYFPEKLVDSPATMDYVVYAISPREGKSNNNFNYLTRGENRKALYKKGYDNLDAKTKAQVDRADAGFTQRLKEDTVLYRGESMVGTVKRNPKVGDKLDSSSWTYTQLLPEHTAQYRHGVTAGTAEQLFNMSEGTIYRLHTKAGTPVFYAPAGGKKGSLVLGGRTEFILPRGIDMTVTGITKGFLEPFTGSEGKSILRSGENVKLIPAKIIDVEVDATNAIAPRLNGRIGEATAPGISDTVIQEKKSGKAPKQIVDYTAGVTDSGVPYKYTIEGGEITSFEKITDDEGVAIAVSNITGAYGITPDTVSRIGIQNAQAINRTIMFYRDNTPSFTNTPATFKFSNEPGVWGFIPHTSSPEYGWKVVDGHLEADGYPIYLGAKYAKGREAELLADKRREVASGFKPVNTATAESTPTHESGHNIMVQITQARINRKVDDGELTLPNNQYDLLALIEKEHDNLHDELVAKAMDKLGYKKPTEADITQQAATISDYASSTDYGRGESGMKRRYEVFSEAMRMYQGNGANSSKFCLAIVEEVKTEAGKYAVAVDPATVMAKNGLDAPKGLFKNNQYAFPSNVRGDKSKAKWLDEWRQKNPYAKKKGEMTEEDYRMANLWDTYFQKEIRAYNPESTSSMPDILVKKNGNFLEKLSKESAKMMVDEIRKASIKGFSQELATMALSRNSKDINDAMESFIVQRVNQSAEAIAKKMPGGLTEENLNTARMTLWSEDTLKNDVVNMMSSLVPDGDVKDIQSFVSELFDTQAKGFASYEALPIETKKLLHDKEKLQQELNKNNNYAIAKGKAASKKLEGYTGDVTQVIHYKQGGEDVYVMTSDPVIASVLKRPTEYKSTGVAVEALAQTANFISRMYRIGTTGISPLAIVRNVLRDPMQATIQGGFNPLNMNLSPEVFYHTLRNYGLDDATIKTVSERLGNWAASSTLTQEMRNMGVQRGGLGYRNGVEKATKKLNSIGDTKVIEALEAPLDTWESVFRTQIAQQSFIKNYDRTKNVDKAMGAAMFDASNSTTNFSHSVGLFKRATSTVPYLSSAINGTASFWRQFNIDPVGMVTRITAGFMVPAMAITAWNLSNEERRQKYMNLPEWYRDSHIVLFDLDNNAISFPIPEEISQFYGTARRLIEFTQGANQQGIPTILAQGAFGFLPADVDGYFSSDGSIDMGRGTVQLLSGLMPQAVTAIYEFIAEQDLYTGADLSNYSGLNKTINLLSNIFGNSVKNWANDIGMLMGVSSDQLVGKSTADTLARDLFGMGFKDSTNQFMNMIGKPSEVDSATGKEIKATGLFAENEKLQQQIADLNKKIATSTGDTKAEYERQKQELIDNFSERVGTLVNNYMNLYTITGGLEDWQKSKIVSILTLGSASSSSASDTYQYADTSQAYLNERGLAQQRYVNAGLPAGPSENSILRGDNSIALQAAINRFYGVPKQAAADFTNALKGTGLKDIRNEFYNAVSKIYDIADESGTTPDYDMIEKIQARYLQAVDTVLVPIINQYGMNILNNNDFINEVRSYVNGMVPSNDWRKSTKNAKKYLSTKEFPLATVDVKDWLIDRYSTGIKNRNIASDSIVTQKIQEIQEDIDNGRSGAAKGKIDSLKSGIKKANYYISAQDMQTLTQLNNMIK